MELKEFDHLTKPIRHRGTAFHAEKVVGDMTMLCRTFALFILLQGFLLPMIYAQNPDSVLIMKKLIAKGLPPDQKLRYLNKLCAIYWTVDPDSSLWYGWQGLPLLKSAVPQKYTGNLYFVLGMAWENKGNPDSALWYLNKSRATFDVAGDKRLYFRAIEQIGSLYRILGQYDSAIVLMNSALEYFKSTGNKFEIMSSLFNIGSVYFEQNHLNKALEYYLAASAYDSILNDTSAMATTAFGTGNIYLSLADLFKSYNREKSRKYYTLSQEHFRRCAALFSQATNKTERCFTSMSLLSCFIGEGRFASADSLIIADSACLSFPDPRIKAGFRISQALLYNEKGMKAKSLKILQKVANTHGEITILPEYHQAMIQMAGLLWDYGHRDSAWRVAERSLDWGRKKGVYPLVSQALGMMAEWYKASGDLSKALETFKASAGYRDSVFKQIGHEIFDETELKFRNQLLHSKLVAMEADNKIQKSRNLIIRLAGTIVLLVLLLMVGLLAARHKITNRKRLEALQTLHLADQEKKIIETEVENLRLGMQVREQELIYHTLQSADLNQTNRSIREKLGEFLFRFQKKKDQEDFSQALGKIFRDSQREPMADFEIIFREMHSGFFEKLLAVCPDLSKSELQICALLRLNLSSKDIARLVNLTAASVDVTRSHIRKKLLLDQNKNLTSYLIMLG